MRSTKAMGFMLLEALVALFIFSLGILGVIAFQASSTKLTADARYRTEAALYADELISRMRLADRATLSANYSTGGAALNAWIASRLNAAATRLPGAAVIVTITQDMSVPAGQGAFLANVSVRWDGPGTAAAAKNAADLAAIQAAEQGRYDTTAYIQ